MREHHAYLRLMLDLARSGARRFDVVHNNSLHHLPVAMAEALEIPLVTTLHTPPVAWLESAARFAPSSSRFVAVSDQMDAAWRHVVEATTVYNGVDTDLWSPGPGGAGAVWCGTAGSGEGAARRDRRSPVGRRAVAAGRPGLRRRLLRSTRSFRVSVTTCVGWDTCPSASSGDVVGGRASPW